MGEKGTNMKNSSENAQLSLPQLGILLNSSPEREQNSKNYSKTPNGQNTQRQCRNLLVSAGSLPADRRYSRGSNTQDLMAAAGRLIACHELISPGSTRIQNSRKQMELHKLLNLTDVQRQQIRFSSKDQVLSWNPAIFHVSVKFVCRSVNV